MTEMAACPIKEQAWRMSQGQNLREWRLVKNLTLEAAADRIAIVAEQRKIPRSSRKVPTTHPSLLRWESGEVDVKELGLSCIAEAYGETVAALREPPPKPGSPRTRQVNVPEGDAHAVEAFIEALKIRKGG